ncbi:MAG TPA: Ran-binding zinc finger domain-containing protein, partial [Anaerolineae bacterium]|nr:Ran-binding zinc finger domain-containing protein [Anaerolineae bacterium]
MAQTCPTCGARNDETAAKCVSCGAPLPLISDPSTLREAWEAAKLRKELRSAGVWSLLWGLFAIVTGMATLETSGLNAVLVAIGLFLIGTGIAAWRAPGPTTAALDAAALLAVGVWNIGITLLGGESTERFWAIAGIVQIVWAVQRFARRARFARLRHVPEAAIERATRLVEGAQKARLAQVADVIEFRAGGKRWRARLAPDVIALVTGNGREVRFLSPEQFDLTAQGPGTGVIRATVRAGAERWDGSLSSTMWDRYQAWV